MVSPFKTGNGLVLESNVYTPAIWFLDSSPTAGKSTSVYLNTAREFRTHPGCYWEVIGLPEGKIRLKTVATGSNRQYLDSSFIPKKSESVYLADSSAGRGSYWKPILQSDGSYTFKSDTPSLAEWVLYADPISSKEDMVYLANPTEVANTRWNVLLTNFTGNSVQDIIIAAYPSMPISSCEPNATYGSMKYDHLHSIWKNTQLGDDQITSHPSDFAVCLKTEVYKHSNNPDSPWPNDKGSLCGIMWGSIEGKMCAINFTIDPFQKLILFDPQNGQQIDTDKYTPTFCMV